MHSQEKNFASLEEAAVELIPTENTKFLASKIGQFTKMIPPTHLMIPKRKRMMKKN